MESYARDMITRYCLVYCFPFRGLDFQFPCRVTLILNFSFPPKGFGRDHPTVASALLCPGPSMIKNKKERTPSPDPPGPMKNPNPVAGLAKVELIQFQGVLDGTGMIIRKLT